MDGCEAILIALRISFLIRMWIAPLNRNCPVAG
jgi:hypothetical protein